MTNEIMLLSEIWDAAQRYNRAKTIQLYKHKISRYALQQSAQYYNIKRPDGNPTQNLLKLAQNVCLVFGLNYDDFKDVRRDQVVSYPRHVYHKVAVDNYLGSFMSIAKHSGRTDHTTVIASFKRANNLIETEDKLFCNYWHRYIIHGDSLFTNIYNPELKIQTI